jgi:hypothetical protein
MNVPSYDDRDSRHGGGAGRDTISAVKLSQRLTADIDAWAETHNMVRSDAIRQLVELGLDAAPGPHRTVQREPADIEERAVEQIGRMLDPTLSAEERERRTRRLIEGPAEFSDQRIDLPKHER